jgi:hypothetical protein
MLAFLEAEMVERVEVMRLLRIEAAKPDDRKPKNVDGLRRHEKAKRIERIKARDGESESGVSNS